MNALVSFALRRRVLIVILLILSLAGGVASFLALNIEAYPDPVPPLVDIVTQNTGQSADAIAIRPIRAGRASDGFVEVLDGVKPGERVVTKGSLFIDRSATG